MSLSSECQEFHLTPRGWVEGSFRGDVLDGGEDMPTPDDRVLTIECHEEPYSNCSFYDCIAWESDDKDAVRRLKKEFGGRPKWFGYKEVEYMGRRR
jgi:hypothetical protein